MSETPTGKTKDVRWEIGVARTVRHDLESVWAFLVSLDGVAIWLGTLDEPLALGDPYRTAEGTRGEVRSLRPGDRVRLTWQPLDRQTDATVQIALSQAATGTTIRFHTERLADADEREHMRAHWKAIADEIEQALDGS